MRTSRALRQLLLNPGGALVGVIYGQVLGRVGGAPDRHGGVRLDRVVVLGRGGIGLDLRQAWLVHALATRFTPQERTKIIEAIALLERIVDEQPSQPKGRR